jgi:bifunctional DNA-binding transcriptional regulator/antitoxin component of YhaV-PrlF toxin-antitoxin module
MSVEIALPATNERKKTLTVRAVLGEKGRLVIPVAMREALGLEVGDVVDLRVEHRELRLSTMRNRIAEVQERMRKFYGPERLISDELSAERREAAARGE